MSEWAIYSPFAWGTTLTSIDEGTPRRKRTAPDYVWEYTPVSNPLILALMSMHYLKVDKATAQKVRASPQNYKLHTSIVAGWGSPSDPISAAHVFASTLVKLFDKTYYWDIEPGYTPLEVVHAIVELFREPSGKDVRHLAAVLWKHMKPE